MMILFVSRSESGRHLRGLSRKTFAILCALLEASDLSKTHLIPNLTIEHILSQELTEEWVEELGDEAELIHSEYRHRLPNLTLFSKADNSKLLNKPFHEKKELYEEHAFKMNRLIGSEMSWNEKALLRRAEKLCQQVIDRWPWTGGPGPEPR